MVDKSTTTEIVHVGKFSYEFKFDFTALSEMDDQRGHNCFDDAGNLAVGQSKPSLVLEILEVAIRKVNRDEVSIADSKIEAEKFITRAGFQTAHTVAQKLLAFVLVGDVKKLELLTLEKTLEELSKAQGLKNSRFPNFINLLYLWICRFVIFGMGAWLIFSPLGLPSLLN